MKTRKPRTPRKPQPPAYTFERTSHDGIAERLALASLAFSKTWASPYERHRHQFMHTVRMMSKKEGWEARFMWMDSCDRIDTANPGFRREAAEAIEGARLAWWHTQHPDNQLLAIVEAAKAKAAARERKVA